MKKPIGFGGENIVFANRDEVIKKPFGIRYFINPEETCRELSCDIEVLKKYFKKYLAPTRVEILENTRKRPTYTVTQKFIEGEPLKRNHLKDPKIKRQFDEILKINEKMIRKESKSYEFFGIWTLLFSRILKQINNIRVEKGTGKLFIIDIGTLYLNRNYHSRILRSLYNWAYRKQEKLLDSFISKT